MRLCPSTQSMCALIPSMPLFSCCCLVLGITEMGARFFSLATVIRRCSGVMFFHLIQKVNQHLLPVRWMHHLFFFAINGSYSFTYLAVSGTLTTNYIPTLSVEIIGSQKLDWPQTTALQFPVNLVSPEGNHFHLNFGLNHLLGLYLISDYQGKRGEYVNKRNRWHTIFQQTSITVAAASWLLTFVLNDVLVCADQHTQIGNASGAFFTTNFIGACDFHGVTLFHRPCS